MSIGVVVMGGNWQRGSCLTGVVVPRVVVLGVAFPRVVVLTLTCTVYKNSIPYKNILNYY